MTTEDSSAPVVLTEEDTTVFRQLAEARKHRGEWEKIEETLRKRALQILKGDGTSLVGITASGEPAAHIDVSSRRTVDSKKLEALYPDVYNAVVKETIIEKVVLDQ